jgi:hypothetical protein
MLAKQFLSKRILAAGALKSTTQKAQRNYVVIMKNTMATAMKSSMVGSKFPLNGIYAG